MRLISLNQILGLPVIADKSKRLLGKVVDLVLDYKTGKFLGLILEGQKVISPERIKDFNGKQILVSEEVGEILRLGKIQDILQSGIKIKGNKVITETGTKLGKVVDFEVDLILNKLSTIFVKAKILEKPLIIPSSQIISIKKEAILVYDQVIKIAEPQLVGI